MGREWFLWTWGVDIEGEEELVEWSDGYGVWEFLFMFFSLLLYIKVNFNSFPFFFFLISSLCFIKLHISAKKLLVDNWIIEFVSLNVLIVINKYTIFSLHIKFFPSLLLWNLCICKWSKYSKMTNWQLSSIPFGCLLWNTLCRHLFDINDAHVVASAQNSFDRSFSKRMFLNISTIVLFFLSATPFYWDK